MDALDQLQHLVRIDRNAMRAYSQAIENVNDDGVRTMLSGFRDDHQRHIADLSAVIRRLGAQVPQSPHMAAFAIAGFTGVAAGMGAAGALMAMQSNEVVTNHAYELALNADLPVDVQELLRRNLADERRHLDTIRAQLEQSSLVGPVMSGSATVQGIGTSLWMNVLRANPMATAVAATGAAFLLGNYLRGRKEREEPRAQ